jgi:hypothetical protein
MQRLKCENCKSASLEQFNDVFICRNCGTRYNSSANPTNINVNIQNPSAPFYPPATGQYLLVPPKGLKLKDVFKHLKPYWKAEIILLYITSVTALITGAVFFFRWFFGWIGQF